MVDDDGTPLLLRERSGDYIRDLMAEAAGFDGEPASARRARRSRPARATAASRRSSAAGGSWQLLATRSSQSIDWRTLIRACAEADIVVSDRWLPRGCTPRWLKLDRDALGRTGGVAIYLGETPRVDTVAERVGRHPWAADARCECAMRPAFNGESAHAAIVIEREMPGVGALGADELKGASQTSCSVLRDLGPEIQWVHSYVTDDKIYCIYRAPSEELIRQHAERRLPGQQHLEVRATIDPTTAE